MNNRLPDNPAAQIKNRTNPNQGGPFEKGILFVLIIAISIMYGRRVSFFRGERIQSPVFCITNINGGGITGHNCSSKDDISKKDSDQARQWSYFEGFTPPKLWQNILGY